MKVATFLSALERLHFNHFYPKAMKRCDKNEQVRVKKGK
jgi:hypothetical protein